MDKETTISIVFDMEKGVYVVSDNGNIAPDRTHSHHLEAECDAEQRKAIFGGNIVDYS